jgi:hypothetical protein
MEAVGGAASAGKLGIGHRLAGRLLHPGRLQHVAGLVIVSGHGVHQDHAAR